MKPGLYDFDLQQNQMRVFDGEAMVQVGDKQIKLKADHELAVAPTFQRRPRSSTRRLSTATIFTAGAACGRIMWPKPMWTRRAL